MLELEMGKIEFKLCLDNIQYTLGKMKYNVYNNVQSNSTQVFSFEVFG